jgi:FlaA1/EpsC-like NDP-sugar epimerase/lipopolysaccharide/colanic/teichoic acid biosynthesis glycosyltransferase
VIRLFDIVFSAIGLILLSPIFLLIYIVIRLESRGGGFYVQERIGKDGQPFGLYKFRTMRRGSDKMGLITIGERDERITRFGYFLRRYKLDELPQLYNVLKGDMSMVGPRPEVRKYVDLYTEEQREVLSVKPGITDYASIAYVNENEILGSAEDPEKAYVEQVMPDKIKLNMKYIHHKSVVEYFKIIFLTFRSIMSLGSLNKLANWYFNKKSLPFWCIFLMDCIVVFFSYLFVYQQTNSGKDTLEVVEYLSASILLYLVFYAIGFKVFRTYSGILRYSSFVDLKKVGYAMLAGMMLTLGAQLLLCGHRTFSYITPVNIILASILATCVLWMVRIAVKTLYDVSLASIDSQYAYIYGVKNGGIAIAKHIRNENPARFDLRGFVSDDKKEEDKILMGVRVHPLDEQLVQTMVDEGIEALIISPYRAKAFRDNEKLQDELIKAGIHIYVTQQAKEWDGTEEKTQLKEISIEDLLPRDEIVVDMKSVEEKLTGKCIMITGSAGSIGMEMVLQVAEYKPSQLILIDQAETPQHDVRLMMEKMYPALKTETIVASICNVKHMEALFSKYRPDYLFHAAAYKHVPMLENNPGESIFNNIYGTRTIADLAVKYGVKKFVMISTDKAVNPTNVMGCSKRICEIYVQSLDKAVKEGRVQGCTQFVTTRFGNVLGSNGSVIPLFEQQIKKGGPVTVTDPEVIRYFMLIPEACKLVLEAGTKSSGGEIFVFDMGKPVKIADLARRMISLSGAKNVEIKYTGLRDGEKLYEELLNVEESTKPSFHEKIRIATVREYDYAEVCRDIDELIAISERYDDMATVRKMKQMVPEYKSNHSVFEKLDATL